MQKETTAYTGFARVYDIFMSDVPYKEWYGHIKEILEAHEISDGLVLELCCGTGSLTELLAAGGYDMIGVDNSEEMLQIATVKKEKSGADILYLLQDMREFELYGTVRAVVCICDSINYITSEEDLRNVFSLVNNYLDPQGVFIFDMKTVYYFREIMGDYVIADHREEGSMIWENNYDEEDQTNAYELTFFMRQPDGFYMKHQEQHFQRAYEIQTIKRLLQEAGLVVEAVCDADTQEEPFSESERVYFVARENSK